MAMIEDQRAEAKQRYLSEVIHRLRSSGFKIDDNVEYDGQRFIHVAQKRAFEFETLSYTETFFILAEFDGIGVAGLRTYCKAAYSYAFSKCRLPGWVPFHITLCYCVVVTHEIGEALAQTVRKGEGAKHRSGFEIPVVVDPAAGQIRCTEREGEWLEIALNLLLAYIRATVAKVLSPANREGS